MRMPIGRAVRSPGDVWRAEAARLNQLWLADAEELTLVETRVERAESTIRVGHVFEYGSHTGSPADGAVAGYGGDESEESET
jgi:hypothetical protein